MTSSSPDRRPIAAQSGTNESTRAPEVFRRPPNCFQPVQRRPVPAAQRMSKCLPRRKPCEAVSELGVSGLRKCPWSLCTVYGVRQQGRAGLLKSVPADRSRRIQAKKENTQHPLDNHRIYQIVVFESPLNVFGSLLRETQREPRGRWRMINFQRQRVRYLSLPGIKHGEALGKPRTGGKTYCVTQAGPRSLSLILKTIGGDATCEASSCLMPLGFRIEIIRQCCDQARVSRLSGDGARNKAANNEDISICPGYPQLTHCCHRSKAGALGLKQIFVAFRSPFPHQKKRSEQLDPLPRKREETRAWVATH